MTNATKYDLKRRTFLFARNTRNFIRTVPKDLCNYEDCKQLTRSSGSVGANYIEADESISKKEAKESAYWLSLILINNNNELEELRTSLVNETNEFVKIFASILHRRS